MPDICPKVFCIPFRSGFCPDQYGRAADQHIQTPEWIHYHALPVLHLVFVRVQSVAYLFYPFGLHLVHPAIPSIHYHALPALHLAFVRV